MRRERQEVSERRGGGSEGEERVREKEREEERGERRGDEER
jgi:hypothetical protein